MDRDAWIEGRILWKARKHRLPLGRSYVFADLGDDLRAQLGAVASERSAGKPVLAFIESPERWTLLATAKAVSLHDGWFQECSLEKLSDVGPRDDCPPGATMEQVGEWKQSWGYLRVSDASGETIDLWVPPGSEAYALWNILRMFPGVCCMAKQ